MLEYDRRAAVRRQYVVLEQEAERRVLELELKNTLGAARLRCIFPST
jgi:hypothetical protein